MGPDDIIWLLVYELIVNALFVTLPNLLVPALDIIFAGFGGAMYLILWLMFDGVPPVLYVLGDLFG